MQWQCLSILLREKCSYSEFFWCVFSRIRIEYGYIQSISPYSVQMRKIRTTKTLNTDTFHTVFFSFMLTIFSMVFWNLYCWLWIYHKVHPWYIQGYVVLFISFNNSNYWFTVRFSLKLIISETLCGNLGICFLGIYPRFFSNIEV